MIEAIRPSLARRVTGLNQRQLRRLDALGIASPSISNRESGMATLYSFDDLVRLKAASELLKRDFDAPEIKALVHDYLARGVDDPLVTLRLIGDPEEPDDPETGKHWHGRVMVVDEATDEVRAARHPDQLADVMDLRMMDLRKGLIGTIEELTKRPTGEVTKVRGVQAGQPVVVGTRIPARLIARLAQEWSNERIKQSYPVLTDADIEAALEHVRAEAVA